jgi:hypothetical protein
VVAVTGHVSTSTEPYAGSTVLIGGQSREEYCGIPPIPETVSRPSVPVAPRNEAPCGADLVSREDAQWLELP